MEEKKEQINRRESLKIIGAGVAGLAVGGVAGWQLAPPKIVEKVPKPEELEPIRVGAGVFLTGPFATEGEHMVNGTKMAAEEAAEWFMGGRKVELHYADLGSVTPDEVKRAFDEFSVHKTHFNITHWGSYGPGWDATLKTGIPLITGDTPLGVTDFIDAHPEIRMVDTYFPVGTKIYQNTFIDFLEWLQEEGLWKPRHTPPTMYIVHSDFVWEADYAKVLRSVAEPRGWNIVGVDMTPMGTVDFTPVLSKIRIADPDVIATTFLGPADVSTLVAQFTANPSKALVWNTCGYEVPESIEALPNPETQLGVVWWAAGPTMIEGPRYDKFREKYLALYGKEPHYSSTHTYDAVNIGLKAIQFAGSTDPAKIYDAIFEIAHQGIEGRWVFDREKKMSYEYLCPNQIRQIQVRDGKVTQYNPIYPPKTATRKFELPPWLK